MTTDFITHLREEIDSRGFSVPVFVKILNARHPEFLHINEGTMYRIFSGYSIKPNHRHMWMFCDWLLSLDVGPVPTEREFAENYMKEKLRRRR